MTAFGAPGVASAGAASAKITISEALFQNGFP
jgi:hypothetical protein